MRGGANPVCQALRGPDTSLPATCVAGHHHISLGGTTRLLLCEGTLMTGVNSYSDLAHERVAQQVLNGLRGGGDLPHADRLELAVLPFAYNLQPNARLAGASLHSLDDPRSGRGFEQGNPAAAINDTIATFEAVAFE